MTSPTGPVTPSNDSPASDAGLETDPRFPSGPWVGFFKQRYPLVGRFDMELRLTFRQGVVTGEGRDRIGPFDIVAGRYNLESGECRWTKRYRRRHDVFYRGFNEGRGIWGLWEIPPLLRDGFHIWPEAMGDPTRPAQSAQAERTEEDDAGLPLDSETTLAEEIGVGVEVEVGVGAGALGRDPTPTRRQQRRRGCNRRQEQVLLVGSPRPRFSDDTCGSRCDPSIPDSCPRPHPLHPTPRRAGP
jgi:hypothetical protein